MIRCTCCNAELSAPQFYNGHPYGYTCITKVSGQKRTKVAYVPVEYAVIHGAGTGRQVVKVTAYGQTRKVIFYVGADSAERTLESGKVSGAYYQSGVLYVSEEKLKQCGFSLAPPASTMQENSKAPSSIELLLMQALNG